MNVRDEILEELRLLSAVVNDISRETPYRVPAGYFDGFPALILSLTGEAAGAEGPFFATEKDKPLTFSVPEGYFEGFAQGLLDKIKAGQTPNKELNAPGPENPGSDDPSRELAQLSPFLSGISRKLPYHAPEGYFEELSPIMAPLAEVREKPLYAVPEGYFEGLAGEILSKLSAQKVKEPVRIVSEGPGSPAPVISMNRKSPMSLGQRSLWKYSAAAVVAGLIFTIGWLRMHTPANPPHHPVQVADVTSNLVKISDQDLQNFLDDQDVQVIGDGNSADDNTADDNSRTAAGPMNSTATLDITDSDVKSLLGDVPDGELKSYMEEHGGANDIATN
ncbi:MAG TPA: hypothetical protein VGN00_00145 [Puia sp.]|jgi:hypothetical protein